MTCTRPHVLITGASSGIGRATALRLSADGHHVFAGVRKREDGEALQQAARTELSPLLLDVTDEAALARSADVVSRHVGERGLEGLVNNAGIGAFWPLEVMPLAHLRRQLEVNVIGQLAVTQAFLPLLRVARGRVVMIGSIGDRITMPFAGPVAASKSAVAAISDALRQELAPWAIAVVLLEPASIHTGAVEKLERDTELAVAGFTATQRELYGETFPRAIRAGVARERHGSPPEVVADAVARALGTPRPRTRYLVGKDARRLAAIAALPAAVLDPVRRRLFRLPAPGRRAGRTP